MFLSRGIKQGWRFLGAQVTQEALQEAEDVSRAIINGFLWAGIVGAAASAAPFDGRPSESQKGSLLIFPAVEVRWDAEGNVVQDTFLQITNDYPADVFIQFYYVNGDPPLDAVIEDPGDNGDGDTAGDGKYPPKVIEPAHPGWNTHKCETLLTCDQPMYFSALTGRPAGVGSFGLLDPGGRPDGKGGRMVRGYIVAWAVNANGGEIHWNHLAGDATSVHYVNGTASQYGAYAVRALSGSHGSPTDANRGQLLLNGVEYEACQESLLLNFFASGDQDPSRRWINSPMDTSLTLMPVQVDLRPENFGPVKTHVRLDVWNQNEYRFASSRRMITCWDQGLLSTYTDPNYFVKQQLQTDVGVARIDGLANTQCDQFAIPAALVGVSNRLITFPAPEEECSVAASARTLPGDGCEEASILYEPEPVRICGTDGDCDGSGFVNAGDMRHFGDCLGGPDEESSDDCRCADMDGDQDVDLHDTALFQSKMGGRPSGGETQNCEDERL